MTRLRASPFMFLLINDFITRKTMTNLVLVINWEHQVGSG